MIHTSTGPRPIPIAALLALLLAPQLCLARGTERLTLRHTQLELPGVPSKVIPTDLDGDGRLELVIVVAYTEIQEIGDDRIEDMVQITTVIPALFDRREVRIYRADDAGDFQLLGTPLALPTTVLHLEPGPTGTDLVALTDSGLSRLRIEAGEAGASLHLEPLIEEVPVLAGTNSFFASLQLIHDLDGDGLDDLLLPGSAGLSVYRGTGAGLETSPVHHIPAPDTLGQGHQEMTRWYPYPKVQDVDGDGAPDLVFSRGRGGDSRRHHILLGNGDGTFRPLRAEPLDCSDDLSDLRMAAGGDDDSPWPLNLSALRDIDGDGRAEVVTTEGRERGDGMRAELKDAKKPIQQFRFHELDDDVAVARNPYFEMEAIGHTMDENVDIDEEEFPFRIGQFDDLDGDGREELITVTLDFSIFQALKILATKKISIGLDFHVYHQLEDGTFRKVPDLDLSETLKLDLNNLAVGRFAQFAGDFDGDGRQDFIHLGRGKLLTLHRGQPGCRFPKKPDFSIELDEEPPSLDLVRIEDLDGDGRSDVRITRPAPSTDPDVTAPVRLDLYLSREVP